MGRALVRPFFCMQIKLRSYLLLLGFTLFLMNQVFPLNVNTQVSFLVFILVLFGIPHGALDLFIDQHLSKGKSNPKKFLLIYLANILGYSLIWYFFPIVALIIFILITAYHFGEIDWLGKSDKWMHKLTYSILGLCWILFLLSANVQFAMDIFMHMGHNTVSTERYLALAKTLYPISILSMTVIYGLLFFFKDQFFNSNRDYYFTLLQVTILFFISTYMPLWLGFAFYFGFWHSLLSFDKIRISFEIDNNFKGWKSLLAKAAPFSIMAWFGFLYITFLTLNSKDASGIFTLLFISLSVLALPHLQVFTKLKLRN